MALMWSYRRVQRQLIFVSIAYLGMTAATLAAVCYAGTLYRPPEVADVDWQGAARYFIPILVMPYFLAGTLLCLLPGRASRYVQSAAVLGLLAFTIFYYRETAQIPRDYARDLWDYYPGDVRELDAIAEEYDLQYGLAGYWHARRYTLLSRNGLRVHQILAHPVSTSLMRPYPWLSNAHWYFETPGGGPAPRYQFILVTEGLGTWTPSRKEVIKRFGEPASVITFANGGMYALIYTRPCDVEFQEIAEHEFHFIREKFRFQVGEKVRFPGACTAVASAGFLAAARTYGNRRLRAGRAAQFRAVHAFPGSRDVSGDSGVKQFRFRGADRRLATVHASSQRRALIHGKRPHR